MMSGALNRSSSDPIWGSQAEEPINSQPGLAWHISHFAEIETEIGVTTFVRMSLSDLVCQN
jgi:hypothetical protein